MRKTLLALIIACISVILIQPAVAGAIEQQGAPGGYEDVKEGSNGTISSYRYSSDAYYQIKGEPNTAHGESQAQQLENAKRFMMHADKAAIHYLESLKNRVQSVQNVPDEKRATTIAEIDAGIQRLTETQTDIENAKSMEELRSVAKVVRGNLRQHRGAAKRIAGQILTAKVAAITSRGEEISVKITKITEDLKSQGKDTARLEQLTTELNRYLLLARENNKAAEERFEEVKSLEDAHIIFGEGMKLTKEAHRKLKQAYSIVIEIGKELQTLEESQ
ncbi:MAG TPA: hypothetical protein VE439_02010 [Anaerolineae bacterium]|jgi:exonuclease VII small subunit|nr:hypothetical protein [Anaerolineae bacterium]